MCRRLHTFPRRLTSPAYQDDIFLRNGNQFWKSLTRREAESAISKLEGLRSIFIRPGIPFYSKLTLGLMYSSRDRPHLAPVKGIISGIAQINSRLGGKLPFIGAAGVEPLDVEIVARATVAATLDESVAGVVDVNTLAKLGT